MDYMTVKEIILAKNKIKQSLLNSIIIFIRQ